MAWLPEEFVHPTEVVLGAGYYHLRPIRASDVDLDMPAVMGSRERLWSIYGQAWGWPPAGMTAEQDREDLARHEAEADPFVAIGGIKEHNLHQVVSRGAKTVCLVTEIVSATDIAATTRRLQAACQ